MALFDAFIKIDGVQGESQDSKHPNEIELLNFSWSESQAGSFAHGGGGGAGKVRMGDFYLENVMNKASPKLMLACATGEHLKQAVLTCRKAGKEQQDFLKVTFTDLLVSSFEFQAVAEDATGWNRPQGGEKSAHELERASLPVNRVGLSFATIEIEYKEQKAGGWLGAGSRVKYDLKKMQAG
jgi:type VI secretion system secreted protein Hcp